MALIDSHSCECVKSELDLFSVPPTQTSIEQTLYKEYYPINLTTSNAPIEFLVSSSDDEYLDLQQSFLHLKISIRDEDGSRLNPPRGQDAEVPAKNYVFPINYFAATQFKNVEILLSGTQVSPNDVQYAYRAFLETTLTYGNSKNEQLQSSLFYPDENVPDLHDATVARHDCANSGARHRYRQTQNSIIFNTICRIHNGLFTQPKLLLSKMDLRLKFHRHDPKFCLMSKGAEIQNYRVEISKAVLMVCHKKISASVRESHELALLKTPAKYPVRTSEIKFFTKPAGSADLSEPNVYTGILPRRVVVGLVSSAAFNGTLHKSPLNFHTYNLQSIQLRRNGQALPFDRIEMDYERKEILPGYLSLYQGMGRLFTDQTNGITMEDYLTSGLCLYMFDISQDGMESNLSLLQEGKLSLQIQLATALTESVTIVVYMEREGMIEIDKDRNVVYED